jgi:hypothetical protein
MTDFMTPRGHMASLVSLTKSATPLGEVGVCPLTKTTLQLLPVRYGLVEEGLDPSADMAMPYTLQSRPLGLRLMRDGFLYVLDNADGIMRDYGIKDGSLDDEWPSTSAHPKPLGNPTKMTQRAARGLFRSGVDHRQMSSGDERPKRARAVHAARRPVAGPQRKHRRAADSSAPREKMAGRGRA